MGKQKARHRLTPKQRGDLMRMHKAGDSHSVIAEALGVTAGAIYYHIRKAEGQASAKRTVSGGSDPVKALTICISKLTEARDALKDASIPAYLVRQVESVILFATEIKRTLVVEDLPDET